jgi:hypothetical protein
VDITMGLKDVEEDIVPGYVEMVKTLTTSHHRALHFTMRHRHTAKSSALEHAR